MSSLKKKQKIDIEDSVVEEEKINKWDLFWLNLVPFNCAGFVIAYLLFGVWCILFPAKYDVSWIRSLLWIFIIDIVLVLGITVYNFTKGKKITRVNLLQLIGMFICFFMLNVFSYNNFINGLEVVDKTRNEHCTVVTIKSNNIDGFLYYDEVMYGEEKLLLGSNKYNGKSIEDKNVKKVLKECNIEELDNVVAYKEVEKDGKYKVLDRFEIKEGIEYNLVFKSVDKDNLYVTNKKIK